MGFEMPVDVDYFEHPKTVDLIGILADPKADIYPLRLWKYAVKHAKKGEFKGPGQIEAAVQWTGAPGLLATALRDAGFLEKDRWAIHDWMKGIGLRVAGYENKKAEQRRKYAERNGVRVDEEHENEPAAPDRSSSPEALAADAYLRFNPNLVKRPRVISEIKSAKKAGASMEKVNELCNSPTCQDVKIWDLLAPLRSSSGKKVKTAEEIAAEKKAFEQSLVSALGPKEKTK